MLLTDTKKMLTALKKLQGITWRDVAKKLDRDYTNVQHSLSVSPVKKSFIDICEAMGYDVRISLQRREDERG